LAFERHRPDHAEAARTGTAAFQRGDGRADRRTAAPSDFRRRGELPRQGHMIDVLNE